MTSPARLSALSLSKRLVIRLMIDPVVVRERAEVECEFARLRKSLFCSSYRYQWLRQVPEGPALRSPFCSHHAGAGRWLPRDQIEWRAGRSRGPGSAVAAFHALRHSKGHGLTCRGDFHLMPCGRRDRPVAGTPQEAAA